MKKECRKPVIAGNWKMNKIPSEASAMIKELAHMTVGLDGCEIVLCVPFIDVQTAVQAAEGTNIKIGVQNVHFEKSGAFTGEISAEMLTESGVQYVIVGHSERRIYFGETDITVNKRVKAAIDGGLTVILCVGELLEQREQGITSEIVSLQTKIALLGISSEQLKNVIIAYEPVWAIGTGKTATDEQADEVCLIIREVIESLYGKESAEKMVVQYGGSMNPKNASGLLAKINIDGGLIGGASLVPESFAAVINAAQ